MDRGLRLGVVALAAVLLPFVRPHAGGADAATVIVTLTATPPTVILDGQACVLAHAADASSGAPEVNATVVPAFSKAPRGIAPRTLYLTPTDANGNTTQCWPTTDVGEYDVYVNSVVTANGWQTATSNTAVITVTVPPAAPSPGLVVTAAASPGPILVGDQYTLDLSATNQSDVTAVGYEVMVNAPLNSVLSSTTTRGSCTGGLVCDFGTLAPGDSASAEVHLQATGAGTTTIPISWNSFNAPPTPFIFSYGTNVTVTIAPRNADLALSMLPARAAARPLRPFPATIRVVNNGPDPVNDAVVSLTAPTRWLHIQLPATCTQTTTTACPLRPLASGASETVVATITPQRIGRAALIATVSSATATDTQHGNDTRALVVTTSKTPHKPTS